MTGFHALSAPRSELRCVLETRDPRALAMPVIEETLEKKKLGSNAAAGCPDQCSSGGSRESQVARFDPSSPFFSIFSISRATREEGGRITLTKPWIVSDRPVTTTVTAMMENQR